jgi:hypothetical protein
MFKNLCAKKGLLRRLGISPIVEMTVIYCNNILNQHKSEKSPHLERFRGA